MEAARNGVEVGNRVEESEGATSCRAPAGTRGELGRGGHGRAWEIPRALEIKAHPKT